jgi:hypothetical protein
MKSVFQGVWGRWGRLEGGVSSGMGRSGLMKGIGPERGEARGQCWGTRLGFGRDEGKNDRNRAIRVIRENGECRARGLLR